MEHFYLLFPDERDIKHSKIFCVYPVIGNTYKHINFISESWWCLLRGTLVQTNMLKATVSALILLKSSIDVKYLVWGFCFLFGLMLYKKMKIWAFMWTACTHTFQVLCVYNFYNLNHFIDLLGWSLGCWW